MIFVTVHKSFSMDGFAAWLNENREPDDLRAVIVVQNYVIDRRVQITPQASAGQFLLQADRIEDELLVAREMGQFSQAVMQIYAVEDEAGVSLVPGSSGANSVSFNSEPEVFISQVFAAIGRSQFEKPDDFIHDQLLDWATAHLLSAGYKSHIGFASFDRHRLVIHANSRSPFFQAVETSDGLLSQNLELPNSIGLAHPRYAVSLERKGPLDDGTETFMGFVYFFDQSVWVDLSDADIAKDKLQVLKDLVTPQTPWIASDIQNRSLAIAESGGAWVDTFEWDDGEVKIQQEFFSAPL